MPHWGRERWRCRPYLATGADGAVNLALAGGRWCWAGCCCMACNGEADKSGRRLCPGIEIARRFPAGACVVSCLVGGSWRTAAKPAGFFHPVPEPTATGLGDLLIHRGHGLLELGLLLADGTLSCWPWSGLLWEPGRLLLAAPRSAARLVRSGHPSNSALRPRPLAASGLLLLRMADPTTAARPVTPSRQTVAACQPCSPAA